MCVREKEKEWIALFRNQACNIETSMIDKVSEHLG